MAHLLEMVPHLATIVWAIAALIFVIAEVIDSGVLSVWFAIGSGFAAIVAWFYPDNYIAQVLVFIVVSVILTLIGTKVFIKKQKESKVKPVYSILNKTAIVTKEIDTTNGVGQITINGDQWSAKTADNSIIHENAKVRVLEIDGVKAVVEEIK